MIYKSKHYTWDRQEISFEVNWTVRTRIVDPSQLSWYRDSKITFKDWDETKGPDKLNLPMLFFDVFPEFTKMVDGKIKLRTARLQDMFPLTSDDVYEPKEEEKMWEVDAKLLLQIKNDLKEEIKAEIKAELIKEIIAEMTREAWKQVLGDYTVPNNHKLLQKDRSWKIVWSYINAPHAEEMTKVSKSSISQNIKWKTTVAGWYIWAIKNNLYNK